MKKIISLCLILSFVFLSSGCDAVSSGWQKIKDAVVTSTEQPSNGGGTDGETGEVSNSITLGIVDFDTYNPLITNSETVKEAMEFVYEPMFRVDEQMKTVPVLAADYSITADGKSITVNLKDNVTWQDGSRFTATDVAYTIKQIKSGVTNYSHCLAEMTDYKAYGDSSVTIDFSRAIPNVAALLTFPIVKYQTDMNMNYSYMPVGTGPYRFDGRVKSDMSVMNAVDEYHGGRAIIDQIFLETVPDVDKYQSMFEASELDVMTSKSIDLKSYMPRGSTTLHDFVSNRLTFVGCNTADEKLAGSETRVGLSMMIDKNYIVDSITYSRGVPVNVPVNPSSWLYSDTEASFDKNETGAAEHLGNDGWGMDMNGFYQRTVNGVIQKFSLDILTNSDSPEKTAIAENIANDLKSQGIMTSVTSLPYEQYMQRINSKDFELFIGETELGSNLDPSVLVKSSGNFFSYQNGDVDAIIGQMGMTVNEDELKTLYERFAEIMKTDMPFIPLFYMKESTLSGSKLKSGVSSTLTTYYANVTLWNVRE